MRARLAEEWAIFLLAVQFLTRLPVPGRGLWSAARMAATPRWYPAVGIVVGAIAALVFWLTALALPHVVAVLLALAAAMLVTGALHEDGLADACDGLGGGRTPERALEIMRDSRIGAFGVLGLLVALGLKVAALAALPVTAVPALLVAGHAASRATMVVVMATSRYARASGTATPMAAGVPVFGAALAAATGAAAVLALAAALPAAAVAGAFAGLVLAHLAARAAYERRLGGYTGDCLGAVQQAGEIGLYLGVLACL